MTGSRVRLGAAALAAAAILISLWQLLAQEAGVQQVEARAGDTPVTVFTREADTVGSAAPASTQEGTAPSPTPENAAPSPSAENAARSLTAENPAPGPVVLVAHGFAGSRRLMDAFSLSLARAGYTVVAFDFLGHGRHPRPLTGNLGDQEGTPAVLMGQVGEVAQWAAALPGAGEGLAVVGHSMATNILVRFAQEQPGVDATVAVSIMAPTAEADSPPNLMAVAGEWEPRLVVEGRRVVALGANRPAEEVEAFATYGDPSNGSARRLVVAPRVEHVGVLYSRTTLEETVAWLDATFGREGGGEPAAGRGGWIALFMGALLLLAWPGSHLLPRLPGETSSSGKAPTNRATGPALVTGRDGHTPERPGGASSDPTRPGGWRRLLLVAGIPAVLTPLLLAPLPTGFLPVVVGDYLAVHFATYGVLTAGLLWWTAGRPEFSSIRQAVLPKGSAGPMILATALAAGWFMVAVAWPIDRFFTSFAPTVERLPLMAATLLGTLPFFLADEWLTRKAAPHRGAYPLSKLLFLGSLALAVALDFSGLFFLVIIVPVILIFFVVHGLLSRWAFHRTGSPVPAALANAVAFAWALGVTFPMYAG